MADPAQTEELHYHCPPVSSHPGRAKRRDSLFLFSFLRMVKIFSSQWGMIQPFSLPPRLAGSQDTHTNTFCTSLRRTLIPAQRTGTRPLKCNSHLSSILRHFSGTKSIVLALSRGVNFILKEQRDIYSLIQQSITLSVRVDPLEPISPN